MRRGRHRCRPLLHRHVISKIVATNGKMQFLEVLMCFSRVRLDAKVQGCRLFFRPLTAGCGARCCKQSVNCIGPRSERIPGELTRTQNDVPRSTPGSRSFRVSFVLGRLAQVGRYAFSTIWSWCRSTAWSSRPCTWRGFVSES